jgi:glutaredoxin
MHRIPIALACALLPAFVMAQQQLFRYIDREGRVVYTDTAPPSDARSVQQKKLGGNYIETSEPPYALQIAQQRNPVTLYSGNCGPLCDQSRALLNRRGVPYREIDPSQPGEAQKLKQISGDMQVPVLIVGGAHVLKGFEEDKWQGVLDQAGYPKTPAARITALKREPAEKAVSGATKAATKGDASDAKGEKAVPKADVAADAKTDAPVAASSEPKK